MNTSRRPQGSANSTGGQFAPGERAKDVTSGEPLSLNEKRSDLPEPEDWLADPSLARTLTDKRGKPSNDKTAAAIHNVVNSALEEAPAGQSSSWQDQRKIAALECMINLSETAPPGARTTSFASGGAARLMENPPDVSLDSKSGKRLIKGLREQFGPKMQTTPGDSTARAVPL